MADIVAWIRPWDGDESDLGNMLAEPVIDEDTTPPADGHEWFPCVLKSDHEAAIRAAVAEEREACALIAETRTAYWHDLKDADQIADEIRARGDK